MGKEWHSYLTSIPWLRRLYWRTGIDAWTYYAALRHPGRLTVRPFDLLPLDGVGAEIGVYRGLHARAMLKRHPAIRLLWCVDAYEPYGADYEPHLDEAKADAERRLRCFGSRVRWLYLRSPMACDHLPPLDFGYIDGEHTGPAVMADVGGLWPKIKPGGILGGHDYDARYPELIRIVNRFAHEHDLDLFIQSPDWWIFKPESSLSSAL